MLKKFFAPCLYKIYFCYKTDKEIIKLNLLDDLSKEVSFKLQTLLKQKTKLKFGQNIAHHNQNLTTNLIIFQAKADLNSFIHFNII